MQALSHMMINKLKEGTLNMTHKDASDQEKSINRGKWPNGSSFIPKSSISTSIDKQGEEGNTKLRKILYQPTLKSPIISLSPSKDDLLDKGP